MGKVSAFAGLDDVLAGGFDQELTNSDHMKKINVSDIELPEEQVRDKDQMEDDENTLDDLGDSLAKRQAQNIIVRPNPNYPQKTDKPYLNVAGERRVRAALKKGIPDLWALVAELTEEEAEELQLAENIHRKNLTQMEEAKRIQRDLDKLGSVEAVLAKHNKSRAWLSKILSLLKLPEQTKRLVKENISADVEVISMVKQIEQKDPVRAKAVVDDLKQTRGKVDARKKVSEVKDQVKPPKKPKAGAGDIVATPKDRSHEAPSEGRSFAPAKPEAQGNRKDVYKEVLTRAFTNIFEGGKSPKAVLDGLSEAEREASEEYLHTFYDAGKLTKDGMAARTVIEGFRNGGFSSDGHAAFALIAFLHGADQGAKFNMLNIFGCVKG